MSKNRYWDIFQTHRPFLLNELRKWLNGDLMAAQDLLGDLMMKGSHKPGDSLAEMSNPKGYLYKMARNAYLDYARSERRGPDPDIERPDTRNLNPEDSLIQREGTERIRLLIEDLPERLQVPAKLRFISQYSYRLIASKLGLKEATVRKRIQEARAILLPQLDRRRADQWPERPTQKRRPDENSPAVPRVGYRLPATIRLPDGSRREVEIHTLDKPRRLQQKAETLRVYIEKHPTGWKKRWELAQVLYAAGDWLGAKAQCLQITEKEPSFLPAQSLLPQLEAGLHPPTTPTYDPGFAPWTTIQWAQNGLEDLPMRFRAIRLGLLAAMRLGMPYLASEFAEKLEFAPPGDGYARAILQALRPDRAMPSSELFRRAEHSALGLAYAMRVQPGLSMKRRLDKSLERHPQHRQLSAMRMALQVERGEWEEAKASFLHLLGHWPEDVEVAEWALEYAPLLSTSESEVLAWLSAHPRHFGLRQSAADALCRMGRYSACIDCAEALEALQPDHPAGKFWKATAYERLGSPRAISLAEEAMGLPLTEEAVWIRAGLALVMSRAYHKNDRESMLWGEKARQIMGNCPPNWRLPLRQVHFRWPSSPLPPAAFLLHSDENA